jgi:hypothetical protein
VERPAEKTIIDILVPPMEEIAVKVIEPNWEAIEMIETADYWDHSRFDALYRGQVTIQPMFVLKENFNEVDGDHCYMCGGVVYDHICQGDGWHWVTDQWVHQDAHYFRGYFLTPEEVIDDRRVHP